MRDDFNFHIVNFPFFSSNIPSGPSYGVYISQAIRYARCCIYYSDFGYRHKPLVDRLLSQGYKVNRLRNSFQKFYDRYPDLVVKYQKSVRDVLRDSFPFNTVDSCCEGFVDFRDLQDLSLRVSLQYRCSCLWWVSYMRQTALIQSGAPVCVIGWSDFSR